MFKQESGVNRSSDVRIRTLLLCISIVHCSSQYFTRSLRCPQQYHASCLEPTIDAHTMIMLHLPTKTLRCSAIFAPPPPIIRSFIRPHHIHAPLNVPNTTNHPIEHSPVFYPQQISPERCAISIKYHKYCHKKPFRSQKLSLHAPAPCLRHQIPKMIHPIDK